MSPDDLKPVYCMVSRCKCGGHPLTPAKNATECGFCRHRLEEHWPLAGVIAAKIVKTSRGLVETGICLLCQETIISSVRMTAFEFKSGTLKSHLERIHPETLKPEFIADQKTIPDHPGIAFIMLR